MTIPQRIALIGLCLAVTTPLVGCQKSPATSTDTKTASSTRDTTKPVQEATEEARYEFVMLETTKGNILLELDRARAPITVRNFLSYVKDGTYNGTIFHRVMSGFMIQGGGFTPDMVKKPTRAPIRNEWRNGLKNDVGTIAMARTQNPDSATTQFFINVVKNASLDQPMSGGAGYAVFGRVVMGMDTVEKIRFTPTGVTANASGQPMKDVPTTVIEIEKAVQVAPDAARQMLDKAAETTKSEG
ncbi:MAG TPA: peptidylprolyl isomerase [Phycisphaerales bacterium]|nr:peptidylprolyl isomerase [Phycisphaerales bacterium]